MITSLNQVPVGILGLGFLGKILSSELTSFEESWVTWHKTPPPETTLPVLHFDWANENWGTKWDASNSDVYISDLGNGDYFAEYQFETPWSTPEGIYNALNERFPNVSISWFYREEGMQIAGYLPN